MQINEVPDKAAFRRGVLPMYESFRGQIGADIIRDALAAVQDLPFLNVKSRSAITAWQKSLEG